MEYGRINISKKKKINSTINYPHFVSNSNL